MEYSYMYTKRRKDFGKPCRFTHLPAEVLAELPEEEESGVYALAVPQTSDISNLRPMVEHRVNTQTVPTKTQSMQHQEGGWPKEVDSSDHQERTKWIKKREKETEFLNVVRNLTAQATATLEYSQIIDPFEEYFQHDQSGRSWTSEPVTIKNMAFLANPHSLRMGVQQMALNAEIKSKMVACYADQAVNLGGHQADSFIWDLVAPSQPVIRICPEDSLACCKFNPHCTEVLTGGGTNGVVSVFDVRVGPQSVRDSETPAGHFLAIMELIWLVSKTHSEFVTTGLDGRLQWWDVRDLSKPIETLELSMTAQHAAGYNPKVYQTPKTYGACSLEWMQEAGPTRFLVGTDSGIPISIQKRPKKPPEITGWGGLHVTTFGGQHYNSICSIKRNPVHPAFYMTVGDWRAQIWADDYKQPLMTSRCHDNMLTAGLWSPTRCGVFYLGQADGYLNVWDYSYRQNEVAHRLRVSQEKIESLSIDPTGKTLLVGDQAGSIHVMQTCASLHVPAHDEKAVMGTIFENELLREKLTVANKKAIEEERLAAKMRAQEFADIEAEFHATKEDRRAEVTRKFFETMGIDPTQLNMSLPFPNRQPVEPFKGGPIPGLPNLPALPYDTY